MQSRKSNKNSPTLWFDCFKVVVAIAGGDHEVAMVLSMARALLVRFDSRSTHCSVNEATHIRKRVRR